MAAERLDVRGTKCPIPVLRAKRALANAAAGSLVEVLADDPHAPADLEVFSRQAGHRVVREETLPDGATLTVLEKRSD